MWLPHRQPLHMLPGGALTDTDVTPYSCVRLCHRRHRTTEQLGSHVNIQLTCQNSPDTRVCIAHLSKLTRHTCVCIAHLSYLTRHTCVCIAHLSYLTRHTFVCTAHLSYFTRHTCVCTAHLSKLTRHTCVCTTHLSKLTIHTCVAVYVQLTCLTFLVSFYDKPWELSNYSKLDPHIVIYVSPDQAFSFSPLFIIDRHCPTQ